MSGTSPAATGRIGIDQDGNVWEYTPPYFTMRQPTGPAASFGPWLTIEEFDALPSGPVIIEVQAGSSPLQAVNLAVYRSVTIG